MKAKRKYFAKLLDLTTTRNHEKNLCRCDIEKKQNRIEYFTKYGVVGVKKNDHITASSKELQENKKERTTVDEI